MATLNRSEKVFMMVISATVRGKKHWQLHAVSSSCEYRQMKIHLAFDVNTLGCRNLSLLLRTCSSLENRMLFFLAKPAFFKVGNLLFF